MTFVSVTLSVTDFSCTVVVMDCVQIREAAVGVCHCHGNKRCHSTSFPSPFAVTVLLPAMQCGCNTESIKYHSMDLCSIDYHSQSHTTTLDMISFLSHGWLHALENSVCQCAQTLSATSHLLSLCVCVHVLDPLMTNCATSIETHKFKRSLLHCPVVLLGDSIQLTWSVNTQVCLLI